MTRRSILLAMALGSIAGPGWGQVRVPRIIQQVIPATRQGQQPQLTGIDALRADFLARSGTDTILFGGDSTLLGLPTKNMLALQAQWLRQHPEVVVRIEGHADSVDTRNHALAIGARRADEVRSYLILLGVPGAQMTAVSMGKERPVPGAANARAVVTLVR